MPYYNQHDVLSTIARFGLGSVYVRVKGAAVTFVFSTRRITIYSAIYIGARNAPSLQ